MRQTGDYSGKGPLTLQALQQLLHGAVARLDVNKAREEAAQYVYDQRALEVWSKDFFLQALANITDVQLLP